MKPTVVYDFLDDPPPDRIIQWSLARTIGGDWEWFMAMSNDEKLAWIVGEDEFERIEVANHHWGSEIMVWDI